MLIKILYHRTFTSEDLLNIIVSEALNDGTKDVSKYIVKVNDDREGAKMMSTNTYTFSRKNRTIPNHHRNRIFKLEYISENSSKNQRGKKVLFITIQTRLKLLY